MILFFPGGGGGRFTKNNWEALGLCSYIPAVCFCIVGILIVARKKISWILNQSAMKRQLTPEKHDNNKIK